MVSLRELLDSKSGKVAASVIALAGVVACLAAARSFFGSNSAEAASRDRLFICSETGKTFHYTLQKGDPIPVPSPASKKNTGYPAELCFWTKEGTVKEDPTPVLLNQYKGDRSPTFCPDCGRLVVAHNPAPRPGMKPPPTREQYLRRMETPRDSR